MNVPSSGKNLEAVPRQIELADDLGPQQRHDGPYEQTENRKPGNLQRPRPPSTWRRSRTVRTLRPARAVGGGCQPVVAAAYDDRVITHVPALYSSRPGGADCGHSPAVLSRRAYCSAVSSSSRGSAFSGTAMMAGFTGSKGGTRRTGRDGLGPHDHPWRHQHPPRRQAALGGLPSSRPSCCR